MELKSFQFKNSRWHVQRFGNDAWLLQVESENNALDKVHELSKCLEQIKSDEILDIVIAYDSMAIFFKNTGINISDILVDIDDASQVLSSGSKLHTIKVCYEIGLDWEVVTSYTRLSKDEVITKHVQRKYKVAMMGFLPGFVFLDGLDAQISVPRRPNPRTVIPFGSVGIGGSQTGFYSLESPGGWQIIGRTPQTFFDIHQNPPTKIEAGDTVIFERISEQEFDILKAKWVK